MRIDRLEKKLLENGNDPVVVQTLVAEIKAAVDAGTPLTRDEIKARIEALGLTLPTREQHSPTQMLGRLQVARDAYFTMLAAAGR